MDKKKMFVILVLAFVLLIAGASVLYKQLSENVTPEQLAVAETKPPQVETEPVQEETEPTQTETVPEPAGVPAPDFTVYDAAGNPVKLSDYFGKPIVLNFWASWCDPCKREMPGFNEKSEELEGQVQFLMINRTEGMRETMETATAFLEEQGYTFPVLYDTSSEAAYTYGAFSIPTTFFINADGLAIVQASGAISVETLQQCIDMIYKPEP